MITMRGNLAVSWKTLGKTISTSPLELFLVVTSSVSFSETTSQMIRLICLSVLFFYSLLFFLANALQIFTSNQRGTDKANAYHDL